jgi:DNA repair protein RadA/Sms
MAVVYTCRARACGWEAPEKWTGRCPGCGRYYDIVRKGREEEDRLSLARITAIAPPARIETGCPEFDKVLGGGLVPSSAILLTGPPGQGKSSLLLRVADTVAKGKKRVLYTSGEQNAEDIGMLAQRLGCLNPNVDVMGNEGDVYNIISEAQQKKPAMLVIDSIQTAYLEDVNGDVGSAEQVAAVTKYLTSYGKTEKVALLIVGHVNKDGNMAGPKVMEHLVDTVIFLNPFVEDITEADEQTANLRVLSSGKNRWGASGVREFIQMTEKGIQSLDEKVREFLKTEGSDDDEDGLDDDPDDKDEM